MESAHRACSTYIENINRDKQKNINRDKLRVNRTQISVALSKSPSHYTKKTLSYQSEIINHMIIANISDLTNSHLLNLVLQL